MSISVIPKFLQKAFAATGAKTDIPLNADLINGRAGYNEGFPPINMTAVAAGGIPPYGQDMNGVLYDLSTAIQYIQSGIAFPFDSAFATAIGGYAVGAIVSDASNKSLLWVNGNASNLVFPNGWTSFRYSDPTTTSRGSPFLASAEEVLSRSSVSKLIPPNLAPRLLRVRQIITSGNYSLPSDVGSIMVHACGGGGGGGGIGAAPGAASVGGGGGGGSTSIAFLSSPASLYAVTIGAGGQGGITLNAGGDGGDTSFGSVCTGKGGQGGGVGVARSSLMPSGGPGNPIAGGIGDFIFPGKAALLSFAGNGYVMDSPSGGSQYSFGTVYKEETSDIARNGSAPTGFGGGGGGAVGVNNGASANGALGGSGVVYVFEYA